MFSVSVKKSYSLVLWMQAPRQKEAVVSSLLIPTQADQEIFILDHQKGEVNLRHYLK